MIESKKREVTTGRPHKVDWVKTALKVYEVQAQVLTKPSDGWLPIKDYIVPALRNNIFSILITCYVVSNANS